MGSVKDRSVEIKSLGRNAERVKVVRKRRRKEEATPRGKIKKALLPVPRGPSFLPGGLGRIFVYDILSPIKG